MRVVGREINEIVSPTWKPDTYGPVSTSPAGLRMRDARRTEIAARRQTRDKYRNHTRGN